MHSLENRVTLPFKGVFQCLITKHAANHRLSCLVYSFLVLLFSPQLRPQKKTRHTQNRVRSSESGRMNIRKHTPRRAIIWAGAAIRCTATRTRSKRTQESTRWIVARRRCSLAARERNAEGI